MCIRDSYFQTYGGGWYMSDTTWIRSYNNKSIYQNTGTLRTDGTLQVGSSGTTMNVPNGGTPTIGGNTILHTGNVSYPSVGNGTITISQTGRTAQTFTVNQSGNTTISLNDNNTVYTLPTNNVTNASVSGSTLTLNRQSSSNITFTNTNTVTQIRQDNTGTYRTGSINLVSGNNITVSETSAGTFSFATTANVAATTGNVVFDIITADEIRANHIKAGVISARELAISNSAAGSAGIYFSTTAMEIRDSNNTLRVKIGAL